MTVIECERKREKERGRGREIRRKRKREREVVLSGLSDRSEYNTTEQNMMKQNRGKNEKWE